jgi:hypothetical protein
VRSMGIVCGNAGEAGAMGAERVMGACVVQEQERVR